MATRLEAPVQEPRSFQTQAIRVESVTRRYPRRRATPVTAVESLDLAVAEGEVVAVVGPSGCGKSTLLELIAGLQQPDAGLVAVASAGSDRRSACALMPQHDLLVPWRDALGNAAFGLECAGLRRAEARRRAAPAFARFGLDGFERARPSELSGGMRQRVAFVRTLLADRPILLLDEPFGALDSITRGSMQDWLMDALAAEPRTVVLVTHDVDEALLLADRVAILSPRPGHVRAELPVELERPRRRRELVTDPAFAELKARALRELEP